MKINRQGDLAFIEGSGFLATAEFTGEYENKSLADKEDPTKVKSYSEDGESTEIVNWGPNNKYPQEVLASIEKNSSAERALDIRIAAHYGNGLKYFKKSTDDGKKTLELIDEDALKPEVKDFLKRSRMKRFWKEVITDFELLSIAFPEYILSADYSTITRVKRHQAAHCRFEQMNNEGAIGHILISTKWNEGVSHSDELYVGKTPYIDPYLTVDEVREYCKKKKLRKFIRPELKPLKGSSYYPTTPWHAVHRNGWLDVASSVPVLKKYMFKNQSILIFHIEVTIDYFENKYGNKWHDFTAKQQEEKQDELLTSLNERLTDVTNSHKSLMTIRYKDETGKYVDGVTITAIDNKIKDGSYLPEASAANSEILFAFGVDPTLIGLGVPGGKLGGGGGSDKREAFTILNALMKTPRETTLEIWDFIKDYNGWPDDVNAGFESTILTTLDKNPTGQENTTSA